LLHLCSSVSSNGSTPEGVVEAYLNALVAKDSTALSTLSCADWEPKAIMELDSFQAVQVRLDGLSCEKVGTDGDFTLVNCSGNIIATYNGEDQNINLAMRNYQVIEQNGENLVCGYQ
jgi:hypothetical protein